MIEGLDYDLQACLEYNPQAGYTVEEIAKVCAVIEGERDEASWHWILLLNDAPGRDVSGRYVYLTGSCDYTGWD